VSEETSVEVTLVYEDDAFNQTLLWTGWAGGLGADFELPAWVIDGVLPASLGDVLLSGRGFFGANWSYATDFDPSGYPDGWGEFRLASVPAFF
jgi:hypothetical protein